MIDRESPLSLRARFNQGLVKMAPLFFFIGAFALAVGIASIAFFRRMFCENYHYATPVDSILHGELLRMLDGACMAMGTGLLCLICVYLAARRAPK